MNKPILITGAARSGTSMVAGIINMCGAFGGRMSGANSNNQKGMFENIAVRSLQKRYLNEIGMDPLGQYPLPNPGKLSIPVDWAQQVTDIFKAEGYQSGAWMYKGAKACLLWPLWLHAFPDAKWIIVRRKTTDIVNSCMRTGFMRAFSTPTHYDRIGVTTEAEAWTWWVSQHKKRFVEMVEAGMNIKQVWPERMVNGDYSQVQEMIEWLGLEWNTGVYDFIEPKLWKARRK